MAKNLFVFLVSLVIIGFSVYLYGELYGFSWMEKKSETAVLQYLEANGELEENIKKIEPWYDEKSGHYYVTVVFKDEKGLNYEFIYRHKEAIFINTYDNSNNEYKGKHLQ
ncbi:DUF3139 domain-containing protein [Xanthomonas citri pv. punicae]|nr:DUF3139 domain-containing protein [Xanthomonas citri pv. punicae]